MADDVKTKIKDTYKEMASDYDHLRFVRICASRLIDLARLQPGESLLEIAPGRGIWPWLRPTVSDLCPMN